MLAAQIPVERRLLLADMQGYIDFFHSKLKEQEKALAQMSKGEWPEILVIPSGHTTRCLSIYLSHLSTTHGA